MLTTLQQKITPTIKDISDEELKMIEYKLDHIKKNPQSTAFKSEMLTLVSNSIISDKTYKLVKDNQQAVENLIAEKKADQNKLVGLTIDISNKETALRGYDVLKSKVQAIKDGKDVDNFASGITRLHANALISEQIYNIAKILEYNTKEVMDALESLNKNGSIEIKVAKKYVKMLKKDNQEVVRNN